MLLRIVLASKMTSPADYNCLTQPRLENTKSALSENRADFAWKCTVTAPKSAGCVGHVTNIDPMLQHAIDLSHLSIKRLPLSRQHNRKGVTFTFAIREYTSNDFHTCIGSHHHYIQRVQVNTLIPKSLGKCGVSIDSH